MMLNICPMRKDERDTIQVYLRILPQRIWALPSKALDFNCLRSGNQIRNWFFITVINVSLCLPVLKGCYFLKSELGAII
jgi:hypothetical protein